MRKYNKVQEAIILVCRIIIVTVSIISTVTTASGFRGFVFENRVGSMAISLVIQLTLLIFAFTFPQQWDREKWQAKSSMVLRKVLRRIALGAIYLSVLVVSSGFSYVFISNSMYSFIWTDVVQQATLQRYREELFRNQDYVEIYLDQEIKDLNQAIQQVKPDESGQAENGANIQAALSEIENLPAPSEPLKSNRFYRKVTKTAGEAKAALEAQNSAEIQRLVEDLKETQAELEAEIAALEEDCQQAADEVKEQNEVRRRMLHSNPAYKAQQAAFQRAQDHYADLLEKKGFYVELLDQFKAVNQELTDYQGSDEGSIKSAIYIFQAQLLEANPDVEVMLKQAAIMKDYAQKPKEGGTDEDFGALMESVGSLNRKVEVYKNLLELRQYMKSEIENLTNVTTELAAHVSKVQSGDPNVTELEAIQSFWRIRAEILRDKVAGIPTYTGDNALLKGNYREESSAALDEMINVFLVENTQLRMSINYLTHLTGADKSEAWGAVYIAFLLDLLPLGLNYIIEWVKKPSRRD